MKGVLLEITSFRGVSIGAQHFYGRLRRYEAKKSIDVELRKKLSAKEARVLTKLDRSAMDWFKGSYKPGDLSDRFDSIIELRAFGLRHYQTLVPGAKVLIVGQYAVADPQECLDGPDDIKLSINNHFRLFESCGGHEGDRKKADYLYRSYQSFLKKHRIKF